MQTAVYTDINRDGVLTGVNAVATAELAEATGGKLHLAGGWAVTQMIEALDRGVHTMMPTGMHRAYVQIYDLYQAGKRDQAVELFNQIVPVLAFSNQHLDISVRVIASNSR